MPKPNLLLLHGALGNQQAFAPLIDSLSAQFQLHHFDFAGHGFNDSFNDAFTIAQFARDLMAYLDNNDIQQTSVFGYSMGGYVALNAALHNGERFNQITTLATKFNWTPESAAKEAKMLDAETIAAKVPKFAAVLQQRFGDVHWRVVLNNTQQMMRELGDNPVLTHEELAGIETPVRLCVGDRDTMVSIEETTEAYRALLNSELAVLPNTPHPLEQVELALLVEAIRN